MVSEKVTAHAVCGVRCAVYPASRIPHPAHRRGQATLEMTVALISSLLLLVGAVKFVLWAAERYHARVTRYDQTRTSAASAPFSTGARWDDSYEPSKKLDLFN